MATPRALWRATTSPFLVQTPSAHHLAPLQLCRFFYAGRGKVRKNGNGKDASKGGRGKGAGNDGTWRGASKTGGSKPAYGGARNRNSQRQSDYPDWVQPRPYRDADSFGSFEPFGAFEPSGPPQRSRGFERPNPPNDLDIFKSSSTPSSSTPAAKPTTTPVAKPATTPIATPAAPPKPPKPQPVGVMSYLPPPSNDPQGRPIRGGAPADADIKSAVTTFTSRPPALIFSASRFFQIPFNEHTPEVCLIGRSNVGKSTLINALGGAGPTTARHAHGHQARTKGLAITSRTAGSTQTINAYGYGKPTKAQLDMAIEAGNADRKRKGVKSRSQRREQTPLSLPAHRLSIVDMPGYGQGSRPEWGVHIEKYLENRKMLKGAVFLVDAEAGLKDADRAALEILKKHNIRTLLTVTKAEKITSEDEKDGGSRLGDLCMNLWQELRSIEAGSQTWVEGADKGWEKEIWVTSAGDAETNGQAVGVAGARWAVYRMAGVADPDSAAAPAGPAKRAPPVIKSFEDIERLMATNRKQAQKTRLKATF